MAAGQRASATITLTVTDEDRTVAGLAILAIVIHLAEAALPSPIPGVKPGLANVITLLAFQRYGLRVAAWVSLLRVFGASLVGGTLLGPTFLMSLAGALASLAALAALARVPRVSVLGLGIAAAQAHILGQFALAWWVFVPHPGLVVLLPPLLLMAVVFGALSGTITGLVERDLAHARGSGAGLLS